MIYYLVFGYIVLFLFLRHLGRDFDKPLYWVTLISLFIFSSLRYEVGCDWDTYEIIFDLFSFDQSDGSLGIRNAFLTGEFLYLGSIGAIKYLGLPYETLNIITGLIFFLGIHSLAQRQPNPLLFLVLSFPILIINMPMAGIRQAAAIGFLCFGFIAFIEKKTIRYLLFVFLAAMFHSSAIIFILPSIFLFLDLNRRTFLLMIALLTVFVLTILSSQAAQFAIERYLEEEIDSSGAIFRVGLVAATGIFFLLILDKQWKVLYAHDHYFIKLFSIGMIMIFPLLLISTVISDRIGYYLMPAQIMILSRLQFLESRYRQLFYVGGIVVLSLTFIIWTQASYHFNECYLPYKNILIK